MNFSKEEYKTRLKKVQALMQKKGIELLISQDPSNMNYLTGYDAWSFYYAQCVIVHVNADEPICFVIFEYFFTNLTFILFNPIKSSVTKTCPSQ